jgi:hypothetical protein
MQRALLILDRPHFMFSWPRAQERCSDAIPGQATALVAKSDWRRARFGVAPVREWRSARTCALRVRLERIS